VWAGPGFQQGPLQSVLSFALGARFGLGPLELVGVADVGRQTSIPVATADEGPKPVGGLQAIPFDLEGGVGWGPHLGPGRLSLDGLLGFAFGDFTASPTAPANSHLFSTQWVPASAFFLAAGAGYTFELPAHFIVGLRVEERLGVERIAVVVDGAVPDDTVAMTRRWTFTGTAFVGYRLF
jgi:hypothetical protein